MAAKKSAPIFQRNTNRITLVLINAVLEWILIAFLLLNSLFSYLIVKFSVYFGLPKPCLWCSRLDHLFEPGKNRSSLQDLLCDAHSQDISNLGFCSNHRKLVEYRDMCDECFSWSYNIEYSDDFDIFTWLNQRRNAETCEKNKFRCCLCCGEGLKSEMDPPFFVYEPSWEALDQTQRKNLVVDETIDELMDGERSKNYGENRETQMVSDFNGGCGKIEDISEETSCCSVCELGFKQNDCEEEEENVKVLEEEDQELIDYEKSRAVMDEKLDFSAQHLEFYIGQDDCQLIPIELKGYSPMKVANIQEEEGEDNYGDVVLDFVQPIVETWHSSGEAIEVIPGHGSSVVLDISVLAERDSFEEEDNRFSQSQRGEDSNHVHQDSKSESDSESVKIKVQENEEEDKVLEEFLPLNRKESAMEESFDGSVMSDIDSYEGMVSIEKLKSAMRADRLALNALYAELEEERSASAVAANQTMAMINKLQEDKASMQMEALQYQRMMEEQSEYDQEALHILNELVIKREREKQELEKELEVYRRRVHDFEAREKIMILRCKQEEISKSSSDFSNNGEEEIKDKDQIYENGKFQMQNTPVDDVLYLKESLASFEEERISIIEQLKLLELKLLFLSDKEEPENGFYEYADSSGRSNSHENGYHHREFNGGTEHQDRRIMNPKPKRLLPLFNKEVDLISEEEDEEQEHDKNREEFDLLSMNMIPNSNKESEEYKKIAIEEEVDHVYERLEALEEDREFLKHCISSLKKGDKGLELLHEILHHLRDLKTVDSRVKELNALS